MSKRNILITGSTGGIGKAIVRKIATPFSKICIHYKQNVNNAEKLKRHILSIESVPYLFKADLSVDDGIENLIDQVKSKVGNIDIIINNAGGVVTSKQFTNYTVSDYKKIFNLNFYSAFRLCQEFFPDMCKKQYGRIINISSIGVKFGGGNQTFLYSAAKCSLEQMTNNLSKLGSEKNVLINTVRAGVVDTLFHDNITSKVLEERKNMIPVKRLGNPEDIANMVEYLISDKANFITGQTFAVSGGE